MFDPELKSCQCPRTATKSAPPLSSAAKTPFLSSGLVLIERQSDGDLIKEGGARRRRRWEQSETIEDAFGGVGKKNDSCGRQWHLEVTPNLLREVPT